MHLTSVLIFLTGGQNPLVLKTHAVIRLRIYQDPRLVGALSHFHHRYSCRLRLELDALRHGKHCSVRKLQLAAESADCCG